MNKHESVAGEEEEEEEEFIRTHGYYRGTQGARCYTDGASLQPDESDQPSFPSLQGWQPHEHRIRAGSK